MNCLSDESNETFSKQSLIALYFFCNSILKMNFPFNFVFVLSMFACSLSLNVAITLYFNFLTNLGSKFCFSSIYLSFLFMTCFSFILFVFHLLLKYVSHNVIFLFFNSFLRISFFFIFSADTIKLFTCNLLQF